MKLRVLESFRVKTALAAAVLMMGLAACGGSGDASSAPASPAAPSSAAESSHAGHSASGSEVRMQLIQFKPGRIEVAAGTEVTWVQEDAGFHTVTSGTVTQAEGGVTAEPDGKFNSDRLATDESFKFRFEQPGTYPYFCEIHPATMTGEVSVGA